MKRLQSDVLKNFRRFSKVNNVSFEKQINNYFFNSIFLGKFVSDVSATKAKLLTRWRDLKERTLKILTSFQDPNKSMISKKLLYNCQSY